MTLVLDSAQMSDGGAECFTDLRVGVYKEIVPMGVDPAVLPSRLAGAFPPQLFAMLGLSFVLDNRSKKMIVLFIIAGRFCPGRSSPGARGVP